jgi:hypothetical protein
VRTGMSNPSETRGRAGETAGSGAQGHSGDRPLADMLLDCRELPRALPMELAALIVNLVEVVRARPTAAIPQGVSIPAIIAVPSTPELQADPGHVPPSERPQ